MDALLAGLGFFLIIEGIFPFVAPDKWKELLQTVSRIPSEKIRNIALGSVVFGLLIVWLTFAS